MRVLELFSGTGSVGKVCKEYGWDVTSLDLKNADINCDILQWDYTQYQPNHFDIIWASPPCNSFSKLQYTHRKKDEIIKNIEATGLPILRRTEEIIDYLKPKYYFIENPQTGLMKKYLTRPRYDVDYCMYSDWGYKKCTSIWTNVKGFNPLLCNKKCGNMIEIKQDNKIHLIHRKHNGNSSRKAYYRADSGTTLQERYRIPPKLIKSLFDKVLLASVTISLRV